MLYFQENEIIIEMNHERHDLNILDVTSNNSRNSTISKNYGIMERASLNPVVSVQVIYISIILYTIHYII